MIPEFDCKGLMSRIPGDDGGCTCLGCQANRAVREAVTAERERCATIAIEVGEKYGNEVYGAEGVAESIADRIRSAT